MKQLALLKRILEQSDGGEEIGGAEGYALLQGVSDIVVALFDCPLLKSVKIGN
jgi:hypothetical protein